MSDTAGTGGVKNPNPQGKGQLPTLQALHEVRSAARPRRNRDQWLLDYMSGALVLSARFNFKPVIGRVYYLYWRDGRWSLSMVAPKEWGDRLQARPVAGCRLRRDLSWELTALDDTKPDAEVRAALLAFQQAFQEQINTSESLADNLPYCNESLPWYPRLMALALSKSLQSSLCDLPPSLRNGRALLESVTQQSLPGT